MKMVNGKLAASLAAWRENAFEMKDGKRKMAGFLNRMINRKLSAAFETWQANASEGKDAEALLKKSLMRMMQAKLGASFGSWREATADAQATQEAHTALSARDIDLCLIPEVLLASAAAMPSVLLQLCPVCCYRFLSSLRALIQYCST